MEGGNIYMSCSSLCRDFDLCQACELACDQKKAIRAGVGVEVGVGVGDMFTLGFTGVRRGMIVHDKLWLLVSKQCVRSVAMAVRPTGVGLVSVAS
jgi:hypothetical protein